MKKAFTMMELVLVIVIVGILAAIMWPRNFSAKAYEAASQIVTHIRYTQHLALNNDKFNPSDPTWYKQMWRIGFNKTKECSTNDESAWCYAVYQNVADNLSDAGQPNGVEEAAPNPAEPGKYLAARYSGFKTNYTPKMNLTSAYKVDNIVFSEFASNGVQGIFFDDLGRAYPRYKIGSGAPEYEAYTSPNSFKLCNGDCGRIVISAKDGSQASILVFAKTGFVCIENNEDCTIDKLYNKASN